MSLSEAAPPVQRPLKIEPQNQLSEQPQNQRSQILKNISELSNGRKSAASAESSEDRLSSTPPISPPEIEVKTEPLERMSPNMMSENSNPGASTSASSRPPTASTPGGTSKLIQNNNTSSYSAGRLKFFKEGRCLLELTHRSNTEGNQNWIPTTKKVYWPPPGPVKAESSPSVQSVSEAGSDVGSSIPSPWQPGIPTASMASSASSIRVSRKERFRKPVAFRKQPISVKHELCFGMKPPPCIFSVRRKTRNLKRKRRQPYTPIGQQQFFLLRLEAQAVKTRPPRRPIEMDRIKKASRLDSNMQKLASQAKKPVNNGIQVQIGAWGSKTSSTLSSSTSGNAAATMPSKPKITQNHPYNSGNVTKIKSELCPVTETCTAATMPPTTPTHAGGGGVGGSGSSPKHRIKTEKTVSLTTANLPGGVASLVGTPSSSKTLPITPTIARIKRDAHGLGGGHTQSHSELNLMSSSPGMQRVKVEIGHIPYSPYGRQPGAPVDMPRLPADMPRLPTSPVPHPAHPLDVRDGGHFISPRKRSMLRDFDNGSPSSKRGRLSTDSRGSSSEGGGAGSPASLFAAAASPPRQNNGGGGRVSSFSIDSIMSNSSSGGGGATAVHRPVPIPASPAHLRTTTPTKSPARSLSPVSTVCSASTPLIVPITPYQSRGTPTPAGGPATPIDRRLLHLAGVTADPQFGLNPTQNPNFAMAAVMNQMNNYLAQQAYLAQAQQMWSAGVALSSAAATPHTPTTTSVNTPGNIPSSPFNNGRSSVSRQSSGNDTDPPTATTPTSNRPFSPWAMQYRGEPKVATPTGKSQSELQTKLNHAAINAEAGAEMPMDLCMKK